MMRKPQSPYFVFVIAHASTQDYYFLWGRIIQNMFVTKQRQMFHDQTNSMNSNIITYAAVLRISLLFYCLI